MTNTKLQEKVQFKNIRDYYSVYSNIKTLPQETQLHINQNIAQCQNQFQFIRTILKRSILDD